VTLPGTAETAETPEAVAPPAGPRGVALHPLAGFLIRRLLAAAATLVLLSMIIFVATEILPGDAASNLLGRRASGEVLAEVRHAMGLDRPIPERYGDWLGNFLTGDLGISATSFAAGGEVTIWSQIEDKIGNSLILAAITFAIAVPLSLVLGVWAATRSGRTVDHTISTTTLALISLPEFVLGSLLILLFFVWLDVLPPVSLIAPGESPLADPTRLVLPVLTLLGVTVAWSIRMIRAGMLEALRTDYVRLARLSGLRERTVLVRYGLRNALAPSVQIFALILQYLLGGVLVVEVLFAYPGLGKQFVDSIEINDVFAVQSIAMLFAVAVVLINLVADVIVALLVPKLRTAPA
jgi:peptide/nickel transport system permease protein